MKELDNIRNAARELYHLLLADQRKYDAMKPGTTKEAKDAARQRLWHFENQLRIMENAINNLAPFEIAADQASRYMRGNKTTFYRQLFERENLRAEHNNQMRTL